MSQSLVPGIKMSRGNNRKNKFNISSNTHTTAEVGYLQPTFSKMLLPKSDLKLKVNDFVRMSSLVVPTFGDLSLRHWFNCTPLSSLWSCYGAYMSQSQYPDLDDDSGTSVRKFMPMFSLNELFGFMRSAQENLPNVDMYYGNLTYYLLNNKVSEFDELWANNGFGSWIPALQKYGFNIADDLYSPIPQYEIQSTHYYRFRMPFAFRKLGLVVKNTPTLQKCFINSSNKSSFPSPADCPYVVIYTASVSDSVTSLPICNCGIDADAPASVGVEVVPFTMRMYQGDTTKTLYTSGFKMQWTTSGGKAYHVSGNSEGWFLHSDDAFFTGELTSKSLDVVAIGSTTNSVSNTHDYGITYSRRFKRLRKLFIGLGYQFNPFDTQSQTPWKLMHYYKAWFDMFYPKRETQYYQTPLSRIVTFLSYHGLLITPNMLDQYLVCRTSHNSGYDYNFIGDFLDMLFACADAKYVLPIDYYTLADPNPQEIERTGNEVMHDSAGNSQPIGGDFTPTKQEAYYDPISGEYVPANMVIDNNQTSESSIVHYGFSDDPNIDGLTVKLAEKLTKFLTKKRIVGKSISDRMRAIFGAVDPHDKSHESTWCFGTSSTGINISAVMSQSETDEMHLGDYAGQGIGGSSSRTFSVDGNDADLYIVTIMSAIVPKISYYQGHSRENMVGISPNDFVTPLWDAVGYEDVRASEYIADVVKSGSLDMHLRDMSEINGQIIGVVPRGTWYKVNPHDTLNGDMSLPSTRDSLSPYVLTKDIDPNFSIAPIDMRTVDPSTFNKIFNESNDLDDHFIIQMHVEADMYAPLKSISTSYDTFDGDEDGTIEVSHS